MADLSSINSTIDRSDLPVLPADWRWVPFSETCDRVSVGHVGPTTEFFTDAPDGICLLRSQNVRPGKLDLKNALSITPEFHKKLKKSQLLAGDILFVRVGANRGDCCVVPSGMGELNCANIVFARPKQSTGFHAYFFQSDLGQKLLLSASVGAAQGVINTGSVATMPVPLPPLPIQHRIAGILSAYDELIENSRRRIKILEAIAHALYREWFVQFRFPGHENRPRAASPLGEIPEGWVVKEMHEIADVIDCLHSKKPAECDDGPGVLLQLNNIGECGKLDMREQFRISAEDYRIWTSRIELAPGDCVVTNVGRVGAIAQMPEGVKAAPGRNMTAIRARPGELTPTYLLEYLLSSHMESEVAKKKDLGTIMDSLNVKGIVRLSVPCPPFEAMDRFESVARPIRRRIELLIEQVQNLRCTRDLLLPRLLLGKIEIEGG